ncbi:tumor necrosis factor receptor superfamily member 14 isoform X1 [Thunnus maccoyii]|uniref:tumor necrosis factor receptor superfamily member 14 isoform X1 n=2 Tax=Thunnus maccoyii TaxID=8240 RepID=UPI001C4A9EF5|nr:tumor necrosis factor receptor superfamily member 14 isoform X1 [Thunnus maccoyii]
MVFVLYRTTSNLSTMLTFSHFFLRKMGLVQYCVTLLMLSAQLVFTVPLTEKTEYCPMGGRQCIRCPAGEYQKSCAECEPCSTGWYTSTMNCEDSCHPCFKDCRPDYHLKVIKNCTGTSDLQCVCEDGFECAENVTLSANCKHCVKITVKTTTVAAVILVEDKQTPSSASSASSGHSSTSAGPCLFPKCSPQHVTLPRNGTRREQSYSSLRAAILCPVVAMGCVAFVILICFRRTGDETYFKHGIAKLCNRGGKNASYKSKESTHQFPRDSFSAKQQPSSLSAANLGPVHVHNPGTVIFSLLSQFTGQVGPTIEAGKTAERVSNEEEDDRACPVYHPTSSPGIHLSEEERSGDVDSFIFPSQEQGKDCHVSKEEAL